MNTTTEREAMIQRLVQAFVDNLVAQNEAIMAGDARAGNRHAKRYLEAYRQLRSLGDEGLGALAQLLEHPRPDVRAMAATFLLRYETTKALSVLREVARLPGLAGFGASEAIKRWEEGEWHLDD